MVADSIEISAKGKWVRVPAVNIAGKWITIKGTWLKIATIHDEWWLEGELEDPEFCIRELKETRSLGLCPDMFTFTQKVPGSHPKFQYALEWESVAAARTSSFKNWWERLPQESRKNVRRSQKRGVLVRTQEFNEDLIRGIAGVNNDSPMKQGEPNAHYGKSLDLVRKDHESFIDRSEFFCAYFENEVIGYLKLVYKGDVAAVLNLSVKSSHSDKRPANALIAAAVERCEKRGVSYLTYGLYNYGNKRDTPLREFKSRNGFEEVLTPRFYIPLTTWGKLSMKMKLHRGLIGILPHRMIKMGVDARARWYTFRQPLSRCSSTLERPNRTRQMERSIPPAGSKS
jgi:ribosomal protein S18 acetylase RimI-like enzyme